MLFEAAVSVEDDDNDAVVLQDPSEFTDRAHLVDFGFAAEGVFTDDGLMASCGTPQYAAPELLNGVPHGRKVDCWSLGVLTYVAVFGVPPFHHDDEATLFDLIKRGEYDLPPNMPKRRASQVCRCARH